MKRWAVGLLLVVAISGTATLIIRLPRAATNGQPSKKSQSKKPVVHDPERGVFARKAMQAMGYEGQAFSGQDWRAPSCDLHTYIIHPAADDADPFFFVRSLTTGDMQFLRAAEVDQVLKQHVSYDGKFEGLPRGLGDGNEYYALGTIDRNGERVYVYVGFDEAACGLKVDEVWYWAPRVDETVKLNLQLLPKK